MRFQTRTGLGCRSFRASGRPVWYRAYQRRRWRGNADLLQRTPHGRKDCSTSGSISNFSAADISCRVPHPPSRFRANGFHSQSRRPSFSRRPDAEVLHSSDVAARAVSPARRFCPASRKSSTSDNKGLDEPLAPAELGDAVLAAQSFQHDADLSSAEKCRRVARRMALITSSAGCFSGPVLSHLRSLIGYDKRVLPPQPAEFVISADGGQTTWKPR